MIRFLDLSLQNKILMSLATMGNFREAAEITDWIDNMVEHYADNEKSISEVKRSAGTIKNALTAMLNISRGKQKGNLLDVRKSNRRYLYRAGENTVETRLSAIIIMLLWKVAEANNRILTKEHALRVAENDRELIRDLTRNSVVARDTEWLMEELSKEEVSIEVLNRKFEYIFWGDYFREAKKGLVEPTERLMTHEKEYVESLIYLLPELKAIQYRPLKEGTRLLSNTFSSIEDFSAFVDAGPLRLSKKNVEIRFTPADPGDLKALAELLIAKVAKRFQNGSLSLSISFINFKKRVDLDIFTEVVNEIFKSGSIFNLTLAPVRLSNSGSEDEMIFVRESA